MMQIGRFEDWEKPPPTKKPAIVFSSYVWIPPQMSKHMQVGRGQVTTLSSYNSLLPNLEKKELNWKKRGVISG